MGSVPSVSLVWSPMAGECVCACVFGGSGGNSPNLRHSDPVSTQRHQERKHGAQVISVRKLKQGCKVWVNVSVGVSKSDSGASEVKS